MRSFTNHLFNIALSGWLSTLILGVFFTILFHKTSSYKQLRIAKLVLQTEINSYLKGIYEYCNKINWDFANTIVRTRNRMHQLVNSYIPIILSEYPDSWDLLFKYSEYIDKYLDLNGHELSDGKDKPILKEIVDLFIEIIKHFSLDYNKEYLYYIIKYLYNTERVNIDHIAYNQTSINNMNNNKKL